MDACKKFALAHVALVPNASNRGRSIKRHIPLTPSGHHWHFLPPVRYGTVIGAQVLAKTSFGRLQLLLPSTALLHLFQLKRATTLRFALNHEIDFEPILKPLGLH